MILEDYIRAEAGDLVADNFVHQLLEKVESLRTRPARQRLRIELSPDLRSVSVGSFMIFYRIDGNVVRIVRILHGSRKITAKLFPRGLHKP